VVDNIKLSLVEIVLGGVDGIGLDQDRNNWRALMNVVIKFQFHVVLGNPRVAAHLLGSRVGLSPIELVVGNRICST
jgi:hypothetical protein